MTSAFFKELYPYTKDELYKVFGDYTNICIKKLKEYSILKTIKTVDKNTDLSELEELEIIIDEDDSETEHLYVFTFVGVIIVNGFVLKCYPKYIFSNPTPTNELVQIVSVLEKYNAKEQIIKIYANNQKDKEFNRLAAIIYLLLDYYENGIYNNTKDILEANGNGEINWNRTVNNTFAVLQNNQPFYVELQTTKHQYDNYDFIKRLHEYVLTVCSKELEEAALLDLFGLSPAELSDENFDDFGDKDYVLYQIEKEINVQFNTRKISLLNTLYMFINDDGTLIDNSTLSLYGTTSFHSIWEEVCAEIMNNKLQTKLSKLRLPLPLHESYKSLKNKRLIDIIEKPIWVDISGEPHKTSKTLIPDLISIKGDAFYIFDAKYYNLTLEPRKELKGYPGVGDVAKQYLYQLAYKDFIELHGFKSIRNCFLMPIEGDEVVNKGFVKMKILSQLGLKDVEVRKIPAKKAYHLYLTNQRMDITELNL